MKRFSKIGLKILTYSTVITIGTNTVLPTIALAEGINSSSNSNSEIDSSAFLDDSYIEKITLAEHLELDEVSEENDLTFLNQISIEKREESLVVSIYDEQAKYTVDVLTYKSDYKVSDSNETVKEICFSNLTKESTIDISFGNNDTSVEYNLSINLKSADLSNLNEDITVELLKMDLPKSPAETESSEHPIDEKEKDESKESEETNEPIVEEDNKPTETTKEEIPNAIEEIDEQRNTELTKESENVIQKSIMKSKVLVPTKKRTAVNGIYTIIIGDNLKSIAEEFGISLAQLAIWNDITKDKVNSINVGQKLAISKLGVESRLSTTERNKIYKNSNTLFEKQEFIDFIAPYAIKIANLSGEKPLYASVIIAQAVHESAFGNSGLSNPPNYNLTGIKGSYNGEYVKMWTWESDKDFEADVSVLANFRKYPSYYEALLDNGKKMRYGTTWNSKIYAGTWVENTTSYKDATAALDGVYATDVHGYANKLNSYIEDYHLTDYDTYDSFLTKKNVNYTATVSATNQGIFTKPHGMKDTVLYTSYKYNNKDVKITEEATTQSGTFVKLVRLENNGTIGWIKKANVIIHDEFTTKKKVNYDATVLAENEGIYTKPKGMQGAILYTNYKYNNKEVKVGEEATTQNGTFVKLIRIEDRGTIGWIKKSDIQINNYDTFLTNKKVKYNATVLANNEGIYTKPKGVQGAILYTNYKYNNKKVEVGEEATTQSGTFVKLVRIEDRGTIGWMKKSGISKN